MPERYIFRKKQRWYQSPAQIFVLLMLIIGGLYLIQGVRYKTIEPLFLPTPTPTRIANSFAQEAETHFLAGNLDAAIASYEKAIQTDPTNGHLHAEMARILTYSTESVTTDEEKQKRYDQALASAKKAVELAPEDSTAFAIQAFTYDWYASFITLTRKDDAQAAAAESSKYLNLAEQSILKAGQLDETNRLVLIYRAEIMIDLSRWDQAESALRAALQADPNQWEVHRVNALYLENQARYLDAINELKAASDLAKNMTFLYIRLGQAYRNQALSNYRDEKKAKALYDIAIEYFAKAADKNEQLGIKDPLPYLGIGRAYAQEGEFYAASMNMNTALRMDATNPDVYGQLGMVYRQARNYEDSILALGCVVHGCTPQQTCELRKCNEDIDPPIEIKPVKLSANTIVYYYTYASLKAAMYQSNNPDRVDYCKDALGVINQIKRTSYGNDTTIMGIVNESENICTNAAQPVALPTAIATATPNPRTPTPPAARATNTPVP